MSDYKMEEKVSTFRNRLLDELANQRMRQIDLIHKCLPICEKYGTKMTTAGMSQYATGRSEPEQTKLTIIAQALNVSEAWLMGYDVPKERRETQAESTSYSDIRAWLETANKEELLNFIHAATDLLAKK